MKRCLGHVRHVTERSACVTSGPAYLYVDHGEDLLGSAIVARNSVHRLRDVVQNQVQIYLILLQPENQEETQRGGCLSRMLIQFGANIMIAAVYLVILVQDTLL